MCTFSLITKQPICKYGNLSEITVVKLELSPCFIPVLMMVSTFK